MLFPSRKGTILVIGIGDNHQLGATFLTRFFADPIDGSTFLAKYHFSQVPFPFNVRTNRLQGASFNPLSGSSS
jgi:hypothetical protein